MKFGWVKCRKFKDNKPSGWCEGNLLVWDKSFFPFCSCLFFNPEKKKLWRWDFNLSVLQGQDTLHFGNTRPDRYAVLQHREILWW